MRSRGSKGRIAALLIGFAPGPFWAATAHAEMMVPPADPRSNGKFDGMPYGWIGASAGIASILIHRTAVGDKPSARDAEGEPTGLGMLRLEYQLPIIRYFHARTFANYSAWTTEFSDLAGTGTRNLYDLGLAPVLAIPYKRGREQYALFAYVPVSVTFSAPPDEPPRDEVRETWDTAIGHRIGFGLGMLVKPTEHVGMVWSGEWAAQSVHHTVTYHLIDGGEPDRELDIRYLITWFTFSVGIAAIP